MKRAGPLLCLLLPLLLPAAPAAAQGPVGPVRFYRSNELGMALEEVPAARRGELEYLLEESGGAGRRTQRLLHGREEIRRWEHDLDGRGAVRETRVFERGVPSEVERYDAQGRLTEEQRLAGGALEARTLYHYTGRSIAEVEVYDAAGALVYRDRYRLTRGGDLRAVRRERPEGAAEGFSLLRTRDRLLEERQQTSGEMVITRYDARGRLRQREVWQQGELVSVLEYRYTGDRLEAAFETDPRSGARTTRRFDEAGRLLQEEARPSGKEEAAADTRIEWDAEGRKSRMVRRGGQGLEEWRYTYGPDGSLREEEYRLKGSLTRVTRYGPGEARTEELYRQEKPFLRITYEGEDKIREEVLAGGEVIRVREYRGRQAP